MYEDLQYVHLLRRVPSATWPTRNADRRGNTLQKSYVRGKNGGLEGGGRGAGACDARLQEG